MATINVNSEVDDAYYRYKMPKLEIKVEGQGGGIKTILVNVSTIAKAIGRPPSYITKYFGCELGAQTSFNARYIVNGSHEVARLQSLLNGFIKKFVVCQSCTNPETVLNITKKNTIDRVCAACGYTGAVDMRHKLVTFILKNPPTSDGSVAASHSSSKQGRSRAPKGGRKAVPVNGASKPLQPMERSSSIESLPPISTQWSNPGVLASCLPPASALLDDDDDDGGDVSWGVDTSTEAVRERQAALSVATAGITINDDLALPENDRLEIFFNFTTAEHEKGRVNGGNRTVFDEAKRLEVQDKAIFIISEVIFNDNVLTQLVDYQRFILQFTRSNKKAQRYLLGALEKLVGKRYPALLNRTSHILKACYDSDLVEEDVILAWHGGKASKKFVDRRIAQAVLDAASLFVTWLKEAETESDTDDGDDDDDDAGVKVVYTHKSQAQVDNEDRQVAAAAIASPGEDSDLNIDDI